ncbi:hypothetical protein [Krasilnikovia sp. MM14-A1259]
MIKGRVLAAVVLVGAVTGAVPAAPVRADVGFTVAATYNLL